MKFLRSTRLTTAEYKIRLDSIDCPEDGQQWGDIATRGVENVKTVVCVDLSPKPLSENQKDRVEGPLDEIGGAYNTYLPSPKGQRDFIEYYATEAMVQRDLNEEELFHPRQSPASGRRTSLPA